MLSSSISSRVSGSRMSTIERRRSFSSGGNTMLPFLDFCKGYTTGEVTWHSPVWSPASHKSYRCFRIMGVVDTVVRHHTEETRVRRLAWPQRQNPEQVSPLVSGS